MKMTGGELLKMESESWMRARGRPPKKKDWEHDGFLGWFLLKPDQYGSAHGGLFNFDMVDRPSTQKE